MRNGWDYTNIQRKRMDITSCSSNSKKVVKCKYDLAYDFSEGLGKVKRDAKFGYVDKTGKEVIKCKYNDLGEFSEGMAVVARDGKYGFIDNTGKEVIECKYERAVSFSKGFASVRRNGKWGSIDTTGKEVVECKYDSVEYVDEGFWCVNRHRQVGFIDTTGEMVLKLNSEVSLEDEQEENSLESVKAKYIKKINEAYDRDASEEEIKQILEDCKDALGKVIIEEAKKEKNREKALEKLHGILYGATAKTEGVSND